MEEGKRGNPKVMMVFVCPKNSPKILMTNRVKYSIMDGYHVFHGNSCMHPRGVILADEPEREGEVSDYSVTLTYVRLLDICKPEQGRVLLC